jgi:hypothetical protein
MKSRSSTAALLAFLVSLTLAPAVSAQGSPDAPDAIMRPMYPQMRASLAAKSQLLGTSAAYDTVFVGHSHTDHTAGGLNPWNIYVGTSRPGVNLASNAVWDFDDQTGLGASPATGDSLQGWWPIRLPYRYAPYSTMTDDQRPWFCVDQGNQLNARPINAPHPRTFGITSAWHADPGNAVGHVMWAPISGSRSMWCGLRELNDNSVLDPVTHQPYNEQVVQFNVQGGGTAAAPAYRCFPGYGNQWDQILYRDFPATSGNSMNIRFLYRARMSTSFYTAVTTRTGWFHGDPLSMTAGNFISANAAGANAPRDSFSVYIGVPVNDASVVLSDPNVTGPVFDKQRRWFNEVLRADAPRFEILGQAGANPADTLAGAVSVNQTIPWASPGNGNAYIQAIHDDIHNPSHRVRLVFRVKTNRAYSDEDYKSGSGVVYGNYTSDGRGAVLLDDVVVDGTTYDFEGANGGVDNAVDVSGSFVTSTTASWKATGKPVPAYVHPVNVAAEANWADLCGPPHSATSLCNLSGIVASIGNADQNEAIADARWASTNESIHGFLSPAIDLVTPAYGANEMGITRYMTSNPSYYYFQYEINHAAFVLASTGTMWDIGYQAYPALTARGGKCWSNITTGYRFYMSYAGCQSDFEPLGGYGPLLTSNANGIPDSVRIYVGITSECFYFGGTCNSTAGGFFDNISLALVTSSYAGPATDVHADLWQFFNDAFPVNGYAADNVPAGSAEFDTTSALVKGAVNLALSTGDATRSDVLADSIVVAAPNGSGPGETMRVDLVFRILPGPGNYKIHAGRTYPPTAPPSQGGGVDGMELLRVPTNQSAVVSPGDSSFWGQYLQTPGQFASPGAHHGGTWWDHLSWNSARCDTAETNIFPVVGHANPIVNPDAGLYQSTYHESDPHFATLGIAKGRCFLLDPAGYPYTGDISCDPAWNAAHLAWPSTAGTGFDGVWTTKELTKIIPDGLLTPGSHVEYFFRKQRADGSGGFGMVPDTATVSPQVGESNLDGHRWQQFGVLPDRWKALEFGGSGMACMLLIDNDDARGDERVWMSMMDTLCGASSARWGAHNGWHAAGAGFDLDGRTNPNLAQAFVSSQNRQPGDRLGFAFDMYGVKASESGSVGGAHIGNRYALQPTGTATGKGAAIGPRKEWLRHYYAGIVWLTGEGNVANIGPVADIGADDIGLVEDFLTGTTGTPQPRSLIVQGSGFAEQCVNNGGAHLSFLQDYLFASLRQASYTNLTPGLGACPDLVANAGYIPGGSVYGVSNGCKASNDVLLPSTAEGAAVADYEAVGVSAPYHSGIAHISNVTHRWRSVLLGWDLKDTFSRDCATSNGRLAFYSALLNFSLGQCGVLDGGCNGDVPGPLPAPAFQDYLRIGNSVMRTSDAVVHYGAAHAGRVRIRLYDVSGRLVRTLADRVVPPGEHEARWDGRDDAGNSAKHGVYFARIDFADGTRINGRVVVLR